MIKVKSVKKVSSPIKKEFFYVEVGDPHNYTLMTNSGTGLYTQNTFAILYGASVGSIAKQIKKPMAEAKVIYDSYFKANPNFKKFVDENQKILKGNLGFRYLPIFDHEMFIGNPYHYSIKQKGLNYIIQNMSSSLCAHTAFKLYVDLRDNYGIDIKIVSFVHDAIEIEFNPKDLIVIQQRLKYWYNEYPLEKWGIPSDCDYEIGLSRYSARKSSVKPLDNSKFEIEMEVIDYYDDLNRIQSMIHNSHTVVSEDIKFVELDKGHPFKLMAEGSVPKCRWYGESLEVYKYKAVVEKKLEVA